jgi:hypothetical protein
VDWQAEAIRIGAARIDLQTYQHPNLRFVALPKVCEGGAIVIDPGIMDAGNAAFPGIRVVSNANLGESDRERAIDKLVRGMDTVGPSCVVVVRSEVAGILTSSPRSKCREPLHGLS